MARMSLHADARVGIFTYLAPERSPTTGQNVSPRRRPYLVGVNAWL
jgi:hypothetical protein